MKMVSGQLRIVHSDLLRCSLMTMRFCKSVARLSNRKVPCSGTTQMCASEHGMPPMKNHVPQGFRLAATAARSRPRADLAVSAHAVTAGRLQLPASADLLGVWRRGDRAFRTVGRRMDDAGAAAALSSLRHVGHRPCAVEAPPAHAGICPGVTGAGAGSMRHPAHDPEKACPPLSVRPSTPRVELCCGAFKSMPHCCLSGTRRSQTHCFCAPRGGNNALENQPPRS